MVRLVERGHEVTVLTSAERLPGVAEPPDEPSARPAVRRELRRYIRDHDPWAPGPVGRWRIERHNLAATRRAVAAARPDVIAVWHVGAFSLSTLRVLIDTGRPLVYAISDDWLSYCTKLDRWLTMADRLGRPAARLLGALARVPIEAPDLGRSGAFG